MAVGGEPYSTLGEVLGHSVLKENARDKNLTEEEMFRAVVNNYKAYGNFLSEGIK